MKINILSILHTMMPCFTINRSRRWKFFFPHFIKTLTNSIDSAKIPTIRINSTPANTKTTGINWGIVISRGPTSLQSADHTRQTCWSRQPPLCCSTSDTVSSTRFCSEGPFPSSPPPARWRCRTRRQQSRGRMVWSPALPASSSKPSAGQYDERCPNYRTPHWWNAWLKAYNLQESPRIG